MITITGRQSKTERVLTGLYSFDRAFSSRDTLGFPLGKGVEIIGRPHVGKSTLSYSLAGLLAVHTHKNIVLADFEGFEHDFLVSVLAQQNFDGHVYAIQQAKDEAALDELYTLLNTDEYSVGILDSIGAISPLSEREGHLGEANMGRRARLLAQFTRKCLELLRQEGNQTTILMNNHWYPRMDGVRGYKSPGGEVKEYLATIRFRVRQKEVFPEGSYLLEGEIMKNRWEGGKGNKFIIFMLAHYGAHIGLTAVFDSLAQKKATRTRSGIKIGDENIGKLATLIKHAHEFDFTPFQDVLQI